MPGSRNLLTNPSFKDSPPVRLNVNAKILGLVIAILACIGALLSLFAGGLLSIIGFVGGFAPIWFLGVLVAIAGEVLGAVGGFQMFSLKPGGKNLVIYGLALGMAGAVLSLVGEIMAYSGLLGYGASGAIVGLVLDAIVYGTIYYLVVISRFPSEVALIPTTAMGPPPFGPPPAYGPPPPPPSA
jgi:hypothetical protein